MRQTIQGKNRVREQRQHGSVRGVPGNRHPYRDPFSRLPRSGGGHLRRQANRTSIRRHAIC